MTTTTVVPDQVSSYNGSYISAFAYSQSKLKRISLRQAANGVDFEMGDVYITTRNNVSSIINFRLLVNSNFSRLLSPNLSSTLFIEYKICIPNWDRTPVNFS
jgi:hypothetical protein